MVLHEQNWRDPPLFFANLTYLARSCPSTQKRQFSKFLFFGDKKNMTNITKIRQFSQYFIQTCSGSFGCIWLCSAKMCWNSGFNVHLSPWSDNPNGFLGNFFQKLLFLAIIHHLEICFDCTKSCTTVNSPLGDLWGEFSSSPFEKGNFFPKYPNGEYEIM